MKNFAWIFFMLPLLLFGCKTAEIISEEERNAAGLESELNALFENSDTFGNSFTGFVLHDPDEAEEIYSFNGGKNFIPASNTKLFTFYAGLKILPDSIPALFYTEKSDSLIFWGTGDPSFLHHDFGSGTVYRFLKSTESKLYFSDTNFSDEPLGSGWAWDDYNYYYSAEKSPFPVFGNVARFRLAKISETRPLMRDGNYQVSPEFFGDLIVNGQKDEKNQPLIVRDRTGNRFTFYTQTDTIFIERDVPFHWDQKLFLDILADTLGREIQYQPLELPENAGKIYSLPADTLYRRMLLPSDNFVAEQLLLVMSSHLFGELNTDRVIDYVLENYLQDLPEKPRWTDGSGLSRYNLFSPRSVVKVLQLIDQTIEDESRLFHLLPANGKTGTLENMYTSGDTASPFLFAKTGTLSNNHSLSGFLITDSGKKLIFSFMNNNFTAPLPHIQAEMEKVLQVIRFSY